MILCADVEHRAIDSHAGIVDPGVEAAKGLVGDPNDVGHILLDTDICDDVHREPAGLPNFSRQLSQRGFIPRCQDQACASFCCHACCCQANA